MQQSPDSGFEGLMKNCQGCSHCFTEPGDMNYICGHPDAGTFGQYIYLTTQKEGHCGPERIKFKQHPLRNEDGTLKKKISI